MHLSQLFCMYIIIFCDNFLSNNKKIMESFYTSSQMSHTATSAFCRSIKLQCELYPSREVAICLDPYCGLGFVLWCLCRWETSTFMPEFTIWKTRFILETMHLYELMHTVSAILLILKEWSGFNIQSTQKLISICLSL